jgi:hypothetical protein
MAGQTSAHPVQPDVAEQNSTINQSRADKITKILMVFTVISMVFLGALVISVFIIYSSGYSLLGPAQEKWLTPILSVPFFSMLVGLMAIYSIFALWLLPFVLIPTAVTGGIGLFFATGKKYKFLFAISVTINVLISVGYFYVVIHYLN